LFDHTELGRRVKAALALRISANLHDVLRQAILSSEENMRLHPIIRAISQPPFATLLSLPGLTQQLAPPTCSTGFAELDQYRASRIAIYTDDFGQLARYREADAVLAPMAAGEKRVIFLDPDISDKPRGSRAIADASTGDSVVVIVLLRATGRGAEQCDERDEKESWLVLGDHLHWRTFHE
jgi:hypothetical protein